MYVQESAEGGNGASAEIDPIFSVSPQRRQNIPVLLSPGFVAAPAPAALPLFRSLPPASARWFVGWRRKKKNVVVIAAA
jgi:hypothetical protein